jgi:hypothetical protein
MSKRDFPAEDFAARQARAREAVGAAGLDWLLVIHPMSLHWLSRGSRRIRGVPRGDP